MDPIDVKGAIDSESGEMPLDKRRSLRASIEREDPGGWMELERRAVDRVLPLWLQAYPNRALLVSRSADEPLRDSLRTFIDNRTAAGDPMQPLYAGLAWLALGRQSETESMPPDRRSELDLDPDEWDASFYASLAEAGGATWEADADSRARRRFWEWYLGEARNLRQG
jgi:hypothetical protein